jgi:hypothetical protein
MLTGSRGDPPGRLSFFDVSWNVGQMRVASGFRSGATTIRAA